MPELAGLAVDPASVFAGEVSPAAASVPEAASPVDGAAAGLRVAARSFFAQPEPLYRMAGVLMPFRSVPSAPQFGQNRGPASLIPWMTSVRCPQLEHT